MEVFVIRSTAVFLFPSKRDVGKLTNGENLAEMASILIRFLGSTLRFAQNNNHKHVVYYVSLEIYYIL
jgi:hypothetical protein